jgi:competence protein ComEA
MTQSPPTLPSVSQSPPRMDERPPEMLVVASAGAVGHPGLYKLEPKSRVQDLIDASGGLLDSADISDINLAAQLIDGTTLIIPSRGDSERKGRNLVLRGARDAASHNPPQYTVSGWSVSSGNNAIADAPTEPVRKNPTDENTDTSVAHTPASASPAASPSGKSGLIDLNSASQEALESLPGIGPKLAERIIAFRSRSPFTSVEDVKNVSGIGDKRYDAIQPFVTVSNGAGK